MAQSARRRLLPWGSVLTLVALAIALLRTFPNDRETDLLLAPLNLWAAFVIVAAVFLIERRLNRYFWGLVAAVLLIVHPSFQRQFVQSGNPALLAEGLVLATLACTFLTWDLTVLPDLAWWSWLVVNVALCLCIGTAWVVQAPAGLRAAVVAGLGSGLAFFIGRWRPIDQPASPPSRWNAAAAAATAIVATVGGFLLIPRLAWVAAWLQSATPNSAKGSLALLSASLQASRDQPWREFSPHQLAEWCWPFVWVVLPMLAWAIWRTLRRGWELWRRGQAPLPWLLSLYTVLTVLAGGLLPAGDPRTAIVTLTPLVVLLFVFWVADLFRGVMERLVLRPPS
jgi:hypothetical protein